MGFGVQAVGFRVQALGLGRFILKRECRQTQLQSGTEAIRDVRLNPGYVCSFHLGVECLDFRAQREELKGFELEAGVQGLWGEKAIGATIKDFLVVFIVFLPQWLSHGLLVIRAVCYTKVLFCEAGVEGRPFHRNAVVGMAMHLTWKLQSVMQ